MSSEIESDSDDLHRTVSRLQVVQDSGLIGSSSFSIRLQFQDASRTKAIKATAGRKQETKPSGKIESKSKLKNQIKKSVKPSSKQKASDESQKEVESEKETRKKPKLKKASDA